MKSISKRKFEVILLCAVLAASALLTGCENLPDTAALKADPAAENSYMMQTDYVPESTVPLQNAKVPSYSVTIDVNPSIELKTAGGLVTQGKAFNDDGQNILAELSLTGFTVNNAVKVTIAALVEKGYLADSENEPSLLFTVVTGNEASINVETLVMDTEETLKGFGIECDVKSAYATDEIAQNAAALGLSAGRYIVINSLSIKEGITVEEAAQKYSSYKINEMMKLLEGGTLPKDDKEDKKKNDKPEKAEDLWESLTEEQKKAVRPALHDFKKEVKEADKAFYKAFKEIRKDYKKQLHNLKKEYKKGDAAQYYAKLEELKQSMLTEVREELAKLTEKINAAKARFTQSVSSQGLTAELLTGLLNRTADKEIKTLKKINDFLKAFEPKNGDDKDDDDDDDDVRNDKNKNNKQKGKNGNKTGKNKGRKSKHG